MKTAVLYGMRNRIQFSGVVLVMCCLEIVTNPWSGVSNALELRRPRADLPDSELVAGPHEMEPAATAGGVMYHW